MTANTPNRAALSLDIYCLGCELTHLARALVKKQALHHHRGRLGVHVEDVLPDIKRRVQVIRETLEALPEDALSLSGGRFAKITAVIMESARSLDNVLPVDLDKRLTHPPTKHAGDFVRDSLGGLQYAIKSLQDFCRDDELLLTWWALGTVVSTDTKSFDHESLTVVKSTTSRLASLAGYPWLQHLLSLLDLAEVPETLKRCEDPYVDKEHGIISAARLDVYIRKKLREQVPPQTLLVIQEDSAILFGKLLLRDTFRPATWKVLLCLANHAGQPVERRDLYAAVSDEDTTAYGDVSPHITDLRKTLEPAFADNASPKQLPVHSTNDLITGERRKGGGGPYVLSLPADQVEIHIP